MAPPQLLLEGGSRPPFQQKHRSHTFRGILRSQLQFEGLSMMDLVARERDFQMKSSSPYRFYLAALCSNCSLVTFMGNQETRNLRMLVRPG
ncbi:hypothetical protein CASFOL_022395 [Castilleja foliolosa]|uniref:Uncharacterized protein n=1 Tax=Castilleja foliolosa TaxID=1961234 RepID=A0ABD3CVC7_9LAMI